ncbi:hypothetical protein LMG29542_07759 [Paraburkholderia humisilvae]|uniref:Uncharacterized protein n=1 Tax=Paraburkholderia humisilvae TaxID=627669 RepID=A0A6J5F7B3_9BURK|nr:hypothetical protein LMG29542_07759 [Paraburkholderia humisilvae]
MHTRQVSRPYTEEVVLAVSLELATARWKEDKAVKAISEIPGVGLLTDAATVARMV